MGSGGVFSTEMPDEPSRAAVPLDADTAERLVSGRLAPDDAPPGYAEVARLLHAAAAPADEAELTGQPAALEAFRTTLPRNRPAGAPGRPAQAPRARSRLVALALAGVVAAGVVGVWTAGGAPFSRELRSPSGRPSAGGAGSATSAFSPSGSRASGSGAAEAGASEAGTAGSLRRAWPGATSSPGTARATDGRRPPLPSARERAAARHGGGVTSRGSGSSHGTKPTRPDKRPKPKSKPPKPKPSKAPKE